MSSANARQYSGQIFTMEIGGSPTIAFEAANLMQARELCKEQWLKEDLAALMTNGAPLYTDGAIMVVRRADDAEAAIYRAQANSVQTSDDLTIAYLVEVTGTIGD